MTRCPYCDCPETHPGAHRPVSVEPKTSFWRKIHLGHPNFEENNAPAPIDVKKFHAAIAKRFPKVLAELAKSD